MKIIRKGRLEDKVAVITGAAGGIGRAAAMLFAREGARLVLADADRDGLEETIKLVKNANGDVIGQQTDVSRESDIEALINLTIATYGRIDILCNNAGVTGRYLGLENESGEDWRRVYSVNVMGAVYAVKHAAKYMRERNKGAIVNTASMAGFRAGAEINAYSASKAALINFTMTAACDLGSYNIRVNAVCPGLIETEMSHSLFELAWEKGKLQKHASRNELCHRGRPEEVAQAILFLASDEASYITGQALPVDGEIRNR